MKNKKPTKRQLLLQRYVLTGLAIGLYFGLFFHPVRAANLVYPFAVGLLATLATLGLKAYSTRTWPTWQNAVAVYLQFTLFILALELRHPVFDWGGTFAVAVFMAIAGGLLGYYMAKGGIMDPAKV